MYVGDFMTKIGILNSYISKSTRLITENNTSEAEKLVVEIVNVFENEINNIANGLDTYFCGKNPDYINDLSLLKAKLNNYRGDLKRGISSERTQQSIPTININNTSNANALSNATSQTNITYEQTIKDINTLPTDIMTKEDKDDLEDKLAALKLAIDSKDKEKIGTKLMNVLNLVVTKGPEVALIVSKFIGIISDKVLPLFNK